MYNLFIIFIISISMLAGCNNPTGSNTESDYKIIFADSDGTINIIPLNGRGLRPIVESNSPLISELSWSPDGTRVGLVLYTTIGIINLENTDPYPIDHLGGGYYVSWLDNDMLLYARGGTIHSIDAETHKTKHLAYGHDPRSSPDGSKVAFIRDNDLYVADKDGKNEDVLANSVMRRRPAWAPDSDRIAVLKNGDLAIVEPGGEKTILTNNEDLDTNWLSWSPNGAYIAYPYEERLAIINTYDQQQRTIVKDEGIGYFEWVPDQNRNDIIFYSHSNNTSRRVNVDNGRQSVIFRANITSFGISKSPLQ